MEKKEVKSKGINKELEAKLRKQSQSKSVVQGSATPWLKK
jgi:hypothetical protein